MMDFALPEAFRRHAERREHREAVAVLEEMYRRNIRVAGGMEVAADIFWERARDLAAEGLLLECETTVRSAFQLGAGSLDLADIAFHCALRRGDFEAARRWACDRSVLGALADEPSLRLLVADLAVLGPSAQNGTAGDLEAEALRIRRAFDLYEAGRDEEAREELSGIGRRSPFARWKLLLFGLLASAAGDTKRARSWWERIEGPGAAASLSRALLGDLKERPGRRGLPFPLGGVEDPRVELLEGVQRSLSNSAEEQLLKAVRGFLERWPGGTTARERERLFRAILARGPLPEATFRSLCALLGPLPEDPFGSRTLALRLEKEDPRKAKRLWLSYAERFESVEGVRPEEKGVALGLVWERMGDLARREMAGGSHANCACPMCRGRKRLLDDVCRPGAADCYRESARLDPDSLLVRKKLLEALCGSGKTAQAERVRRQILERWPSDVESIVQLAEAACRREAYSKACELLEKAHSYEPLNRSILEKLVDAMAGLAWKRARSGKLPAARRELDRAVGLIGERDFGYRHGIYAAVEFLAGDATAGEARLARALEAGCWEPAILFDVAVRLEELGIRSPLVERAERALSNLPLDGASIERAFAIYRCAKLRRKRASEFLSRVRRRLRGYLKRGARLRTLSPEARIRVCHGLIDAGEVDLLCRYAASGRKFSPTIYKFAILEAYARIEAGWIALPSGLSRALADAEERAAESKDIQALKDIARITEFLRMSSDENFVERLWILAAEGEEEEDEEYPRRRRRRRPL